MGVTLRSQLCECSDSSRAYKDWAVHGKRGPEGPPASMLVRLVLGFTRGYPISEIGESKVS